MEIAVFKKTGNLLGFLTGQLARIIHKLEFLLHKDASKSYDIK